MFVRVVSWWCAGCVVVEMCGYASARARVHAYLCMPVLASVRGGWSVRASHTVTPSGKLSPASTGWGGGKRAFFFFFPGGGLGGMC